jgi:hypothetical protein
VAVFEVGIANRRDRYGATHLRERIISCNLVSCLTSREGFGLRGILVQLHGWTTYRDRTKRSQLDSFPDSGKVCYIPDDRRKPTVGSGSFACLSLVGNAVELAGIYIVEQDGHQRGF